MATQAKHSHRLDPRLRQTRLATLLVVWIGGLAAGFFGLLASFATFGCTSRGFVCRPPGTAVAALVVVAVVAVVTAVTVLTHERAPRRVLVVGLAGLVALGLCYLAARGLLSTV